MGGEAPLARPTAPPLASPPFRLPPLPPVESPDLTSPAQARVLLVDDDRAVRETTNDLLTILGFDVVAAVNGEDAIQQLGRHAFDIIVTDIVMPKKDGYALLAAVRSHRATRGIPIIMLSAKADKPDIRKGIAEGADDYLTKPFDSTELVATIKAQIEKRATRERDAENLRASVAQLLPPELRRPLSEGLLGFADILADMASGERGISDADIQRACGRIGQSGQPINRLVERVSLWAELCRPAAQILSGGAASPARGWVEAAISSCREAATERGRTGDLRIDLEPAAIAIPTPLLLELFSILAECGLAFSPAGTAISLHGATAGDHYRLTLSPLGQAGLAVSGIETDPTGQPGIGLGLAVAHRLGKIFGQPPELVQRDTAPTLSLLLKLAPDNAPA